VAFPLRGPLVSRSLNSAFEVQTVMSLPSERSDNVTQRAAMIIKRSNLAPRANS
jgi:hypothetical protein